MDNTITVAIAETFPAVHDKLASMMCREGGVSDWSKIHNSPLEYSKLALIDFAHRSSSRERVTLHVTASVCGRTALRSGLLLLRSGVALCSPRCVFHS